MSSQNTICYFMISNFISKKEIGSYIDTNNNSNISNKDLETIIATSKNILYNNKQFKSRNKQILQNYNIYYTLTPNQILYLAATKKNNPLNNEDECIFKLFDDIENQDIKNLIDKNGELTKIGKQKLKYYISKCETDNNSMLDFYNKEREEDDSKLSLLNNHLNEIQDTVRDGFKSLIKNVENMEALDDKSGRIKDTSFKFQQDAAILERKIRCRKMTTRIIITLIITFIITLTFYYILK